MKRLPLLLIALLPALPGAAQGRDGALSHLDLGLTLGTTGVGLDLAAPLGSRARVRAGYTWTPRVKLNSSFPLASSLQGRISASTVDNMLDLMGQVTGLRMDDHVDMTMQPTMGQFRLLVDFAPLPRNRHWSVTAGFHAGPARVGRAFNKTEDAPTLMGVAMYNVIYRNVCRQEPIFGPDLQYGGQSLPINAELPEEYARKFKDHGMVGMPLGRFKDGDKAMLVPDADGMARARMEVSKFRPYLGLSYNAALSRDTRWRLNADCGVLFWGGRPHVYVDNVYKIDMSAVDPANDRFDIIRPNAAGTDFVEDTPLRRVSLTDDLEDIDGKVGDMVRVARRFKVYPNVGVTLSYRLF